MIRRPPRSTQSRSSAASDVYKRQRRYRPRIILIIPSTSLVVLGFTLPRGLTRRVLDMHRICSLMIRLLFFNPASGGFTDTCEAIPRSLVVKGTVMTSPAGPLLKQSSDITMTGLNPDCSLPLVGSSDAYPVSYTHLRAHETRHDLVCRLLLEKKKKKKQKKP